MKPEDRVGVIQTHNEKGEPCGIIVYFEDLDDDFQKMLKWYLEKKQLYIDFAKDYVMGTKPEDLNWLDKRPDGGCCMQCDYGLDKVSTEHAPDCLFKFVVEDLHREYPDD